MNDSIERALGRIEGKLEMVLTGQSVQRETLEQHDQRLGSVEKWQARIAGGIALIGFAVGILVKVLW